MLQWLAAMWKCWGRNSGWLLKQTHQNIPYWKRVIRDEHLKFFGLEMMGVYKTANGDNAGWKCSVADLCLFVTLWTIACQASLSMGFSQQEYWRGLPFLSPGKSSWPRNWTCISCIGRQIFYPWAIWETPAVSIIFSKISFFNSSSPQRCVFWNITERFNPEKTHCLCHLTQFSCRERFLDMFIIWSLELGKD